MIWKGHISRIIWTILSVLCFILAVIFNFAMIGYGFLALLFVCAGALFAFLRLLSLVARFFPRSVKVIQRTVAVLLLCGFALFVAAEIPVILASRGDSENSADYLILLGAGVNGTVPSLSMINRLVASLDYLTRYPNAKVVLTGGQGPGESISEAEAMRLWLERQGISPGRILKEDQSTSTLENIVFALEIIEDDGGDISQPIAIASSEYHLYRAKHIASALGVATLGVPAETTIFSLKINHFIREAFGVVHMWVFGIDSVL